MSTDRRTYAREWARKKRHQAWAVMAWRRERCPRRLGNKIVCGWSLGSRLERGETVPTCEQCERKAKGVCIDCKRKPVLGQVGKALRCSTCRKLYRAEASERSKQKHPATVRRVWAARKRRWAENPDLHKAVNAKKRAWRLANPAAKKRYAAAYSKSESMRTYNQRYRETHRVLLREKAKIAGRTKASGQPLTHVCVKCPTVILGRAKKCAQCRSTDYAAARAIVIAA